MPTRVPRQALLNSGLKETHVFHHFPPHWGQGRGLGTWMGHLAIWDSGHWTLLPALIWSWQFAFFPQRLRHFIKHSHLHSLEGWGAQSAQLYGRGSRSIGEKWLLRVAWLITEDQHINPSVSVHITTLEQNLYLSLVERMDGTSSVVSGTVPWSTEVSRLTGHWDLRLCFCQNHCVSMCFTHWCT